LQHLHLGWLFEIWPSVHLSMLKMKDECIQHLKILGVSPKVLNLLEQIMLKACDIAEEESRR